MVYRPVYSITINHQNCQTLYCIQLVGIVFSVTVSRQHALFRIVMQQNRTFFESVIIIIIVISNNIYLIYMFNRQPPRRICVTSGGIFWHVTATGFKRTRCETRRRSGPLVQLYIKRVVLT